jgi:Tol biopolymer transport system component
MQKNRISLFLALACLLLVTLACERSLRYPQTALTSTPSISPTLPYSSTRAETISPVPSPTPLSAPLPAPGGSPTEEQLPTATIYTGTPDASGAQLLYTTVGTCEVRAVSISGGDSRSLTVKPVSDCTEARLSPDGTRLAYIRQPDRQAIEVVNVDGSGQAVLIPIPGYEGLARTVWSVRWSPDGRTLALVATGYADDGNGNPLLWDFAGFLYTVPATGGELTRINNAGIEPQAAGKLFWSPDTRWILVQDDRSPADDLEILPLAYSTVDSHLAWIAYNEWTTQSTVEHYDWSPDGRFITYLYQGLPPAPDLPADAPWDASYLILVDMNTYDPAREGIMVDRKTIPLPVPSNPARTWALPFGARWSPDGKSLLLYGGETPGLVIAGPDGTVRNSVLALQNMPSLAGWSPDGGWIYFVEPEKTGGAGGTLNIVRPDGSDLRTLALGLDNGPVIWKK